MMPLTVSLTLTKGEGDSTRSSTCSQGASRSMRSRKACIAGNEEGEACASFIWSNLSVCIAHKHVFWLTACAFQTILKRLGGRVTIY